MKLVAWKTQKHWYLDLCKCWSSQRHDDSSALVVWKTQKNAAEIGLKSEYNSASKQVTGWHKIRLCNKKIGVFFIFAKGKIINRLMTFLFKLAIFTNDQVLLNCPNYMISTLLQAPHTCFYYNDSDDEEDWKTKRFEIDIFDGFSNIIQWIKIKIENFAGRDQCSKWFCSWKSWD